MSPMPFPKYDCLLSSREMVAVREKSGIILLGIRIPTIHLGSGHFFVPLNYSQKVYFFPSELQFRALKMFPLLSQVPISNTFTYL
jgi:hypothetical protein